MRYQRRRIGNHSERGQALILCAVSLVVLLLFCGLAVDFGLAYVTKANLGKAVDAASLAGAKNLSQGRSTAQALALSAFGMNYPSGGRNAAAPTVNIDFSTDATGNTLVGVTATAQINTFLLGITPRFRTLTVASTAQATRARVLMALVLDRSGSMASNGGGAALPGAVNSFISYFDDTLDSVALVTFATNVTADVPMRTGGFKTPIQSVTSSMSNISSYFVGATYSDGGMQEAIRQINSISVPAGQNVVKVIVFFTDGNANTIYDTTTCSAGSYKGKWSFGEIDPQSRQPLRVGFNTQNTNTGTALCSQNDGASNCCRGTFPSQKSGTAAAINYANVNGEAQYRAIQDGVTARSQNILVYSLGFSSSPNMSFLQQVANDPASSSYDSTAIAGEAFSAPTPDGISSAFDAIASRILLRLTR